MTGLVPALPLGSDEGKLALITRESLLTDLGPRLLESMLLSRLGDQQEISLVRRGKGWFQLPSAGHEAIAALGFHLTESDWIFPGYRDRALMHVRGIPLEDMARDFFAREKSTSGGRNLPGHVSSRRHNVFSVTSPVAAQCLPATGVAMAFKMASVGAVVLCHIGDAATRQGEFFEAICLALQERLPIVFVVEDNGYGISTPTHHMSPVSIGVFAADLITRLDGRDPEQVFLKGGEAVSKARQGGGPCILWCDVDRLASHTNSDDHRAYRSSAEIEAMVTRDVVDSMVFRMVNSGIMSEDAVETMRLRLSEQVRNVYARVELESHPAPDSVTDHLFASPPPAAPLICRTAAIPSDCPVTLQRAVIEALRAGLSEDPKVILFGQDIEDPKGGVFGLTKGLSTDFPERVINSPLAEATIVGTGVGLAAAGWRPVFELQFIDFVGPAFNQIVSQVTNLRWRTNGEWTCPLVLYAPYGGYFRGGGMWHSQSNEALFAHMPGLRIAVPSNPQDVIHLFRDAMHSHDPSLILLPKALFFSKFSAVPVAADVLPFGAARIIREGRDVTLVTWGNGVALAERASEQLLVEDGLNVELLDLRTIAPCDWSSIKKSVAKTSRLVIVQEDAETCSFAHTIVAKLMSNSDFVYSFDAPPSIVTRRDVHIPFAPNVAEYLLPSVSDIVEAIRNMAGIKPNGDR